jgi:hypothetical protein
MGSEPAPPPDREHVPSYVSFGDVVDVIYSGDGFLRAVITVDAMGIHRIHVQGWDTLDWQVAGLANWSAQGTISLTDTLANARHLAIEAFQ